ncbi:uncharacterized protein si:ch211-149b19.4 isoform X1, partial [Tachysurus ichikawai]
VIYILPISAEIPNMGMMEGGQGGVDAELRSNPNTNLHLKPDPIPNPDPNPGHLQLHSTSAPGPAPGPAPGTTPSPALPAGVQEKNLPSQKSAH